MKRVVLILIFSIIAGGPFFARTAAAQALSLSLNEAREYAVGNNITVRMAEYEEEAARYGLWEAVAPGLPQVDGSASLNDNLKLMTTLLPGEIIGQPGTMVPVQFGQKFNTSIGMQASMLLFNGQYIVGIRTARLARELAAMSRESAEEEVREMVTMTYYSVLVTYESKAILKGNISEMEKTLEATRSMHAAGVAEITDVEQVAVNLAMLKNSLSQLERNREQGYNTLRFLLGTGPDRELVLTEDMHSILASVDIEQMRDSQFNISSNINYRLTETQQEMSRLALDMQKASVLPTLSTFYSYSRSGSGDKLNDLQWFPNSMVGLQLSVPLFGSGERYVRIRRAEVEYNNASNRRQMVSEQLTLQERQARFNLINASEQYELQRDNIEVAKRVYQSTENKFRQGMASALELSQANSSYLQAESNYINALFALLQSKTELDKLRGNLR